MKESYYVWSAGEWLRCKKAAPMRDGWLHYHLSDGTNGLTPPAKWAKGILLKANRRVYPFLQFIQDESVTK